MHRLLIILFLSLIGFQSIAQTPAPCKPTGKVEASRVLSVYLSSILCQNQALFTDCDGTFSSDKANAYIENLKTALRSNAAFSSVALDFPADNSAILAALQSGNCEAAGEAAASEIIGEIAVETYNTTLIGAYKDIVNALLPKELTIETEVVQPSCNFPEGSIEVKVTDGEPPYKISTDGGQSWSSFTETFLIEHLGEGVYNLQIEDSKGNFGKKSIEINTATDSYIFSETIVAVSTTTNPNARATNADIGTIQVQYKGDGKDHTIHTFTILSGIEGTWDGIDLKITKVPAGYETKFEGKTYTALYSEKDPNIFIGFYNFEYDKTAGCTQKVGICNAPTDELKQKTCEEGYLPTYIYDPNNSPLVLAYIKNYTADASMNKGAYEEVLKLIKKLEPLGLIKVKDEKGAEFSKMTLMELLKALRATDKALTGQLSELNAMITTGERCSVLYSLWAINRMKDGEAVYRALAPTERKAALKKLAEGRLTGSNIDTFWCSLGLNGGEESVLTLLLTTPDIDKKAILDYIYSTGVSVTTIGGPQSVLGQFIRNIEGGNFDDLMLIITDWIYSYYQTTENWDVVIKGANGGKRNLLLLGTLDNLVTYPQLSNGNTLLNFEFTYQGNTYKLHDIAANDYVVVKFVKDFTVGSFTFKAGEKATIPATLAYLIMNEFKRQGVKTGGKYLMYTALTVLTVGQITAATTTVDLTLAILDMAVLGADITMNEVLANRLKQTADGREFLDNFNKFVMIYGGVRFYVEATGIIKDLRNVGNRINEEEVLNLVKKIESSVLQESQEFKQIVDDIVSNKIPRIYPELITIEEQAVIRYYTTEVGYKNFNLALRGEIPMTDFFWTQEEVLNQALSKLPKVEGNITIYRGTGKPELDKYRTLAEGEIFENPDFMSFSSDEEKALDFFYKRKAQTGEAAMVKIKTKNGVDISSMSEFSEAEILYKSKTKYIFKKMYNGIIDYETLDTGVIIEIEELL